MIRTHEWLFSEVSTLISNLQDKMHPKIFSPVTRVPKCCSTSSSTSFSKINSNKSSNILFMPSLILFLFLLLPNLTNCQLGSSGNSPNGVNKFKIVSVPKIPATELDTIIDQAILNIKRRHEVTEPTILSSGAVAVPGTPGWFVAASSRTKVIAKNYSREALVSEEVSKIIANHYRLNRDQILYGLPSIDLRATSIGGTCPRIGLAFPCFPGKYRSYSGHCNNVQNPDWGSATMGYLRFVGPYYADGVSLPRRSIAGDELPSPREVSLAIHGSADAYTLDGEANLVEAEHPHVTTLTAFFAEFIAHDISHSAQSAGHRGHRIKCCGLNREMMHPECFPIYFPVDDPVFKPADPVSAAASSNVPIASNSNRQSRSSRLTASAASSRGSSSSSNDPSGACMEYVRTCPALKMGCTLGAREQINQVSSFIDGSVIYGSSEEEVRQLRSFKGGELKSQVVPFVKKNSNGRSRELLQSADSTVDCRSSDKRRACFKSGDIRVNENVGLTLMHTIWMREHNRIARQLGSINPHWEDSQIFEETRRIIGAELQHITYNELLPALLGEEVIDEYGLRLEKESFYTKYDIDTNPGVENSIASNVLPGVIYSMMPTRLERYSSQLKMLGVRKMGDTYFNPSDLYDENKFDEYLMGLISQNAHDPDLRLSNEPMATRTGDAFDLISLIIQQGRDHGIPGYLEFRKMCKITPDVKKFEDLDSIMNATTIAKLAKLFKNVNDIDLFTGGLAETHIRGAMVGPTFACLLGRQFASLRRGDRYWYENDLPPSSFTKEQLNQIRQTSLSRVICDNSDAMDFIQPSTMTVSDAYLNAFQYCSNFPSVDFSYWKDDQPPLRIPMKLLRETLSRARRQAASIHDLESRISYQMVSSTSPAGTHLAFLRPKRQALSISNHSLILELTTSNVVQSLMKKDREPGRSLDLEVKRIVQALPRVELSGLLIDTSGSSLGASASNNIPSVPLPPEECSQKMIPCDHTYPFRLINGWCNNVDHPEYGSALRVFDRFIEPRYEDGISSPRSKSITGSPLPPPRLISTTMHDDVSSPHVRYTLITMQWGQFLDHDLTFTPMYTGPEGSVLDCSDCSSAKTVHPECLPHPIPPNDPFFKDSKKCLHFARSLNAQEKLGPREQMNQITAWIDSSNVYGSDLCEASDLRTFSGGKLNITLHPIPGFKDLLPETNHHPECKAPNGICFEAGDLRASEQPALASMHTIMMRQHNSLVTKLAKINPHWNDEQLYQTARKIVGAIAQRITYNEFLPRIVGYDHLKKYGLDLLTSGYYNDYDSTCSGTIFNEFSAAVFRFGHSLLRPAFQRLGRNFRSADEPLKLRQGFFNSQMLYTAGTIDHILRGLMTTPVETLDHAITEEVTNHLFEDPSKPFSGMDLISLNIQRARDHGIPPYNEYRAKCNLTRAQNFDDLAGEIRPHLIDRLKKIYASVDDIDLFTGGIIENPLHGGSVGPTFGCVLGLQFLRLKKCDRFWHETGDPFIRFSPAQLNEIRKMTLSKVVCSNSDSINSVQRIAMDLPDPFLNPRVPCDSLPSMDLSHWSDRGSKCMINKKLVDTGKTVNISPCVTCVCTKEGPICNSLKVKNCLNLSKHYQRDEILADSVCKVQCSFALRILPQFERKPLSNDATFGTSNFGNVSPASARSISFGFSNSS